MNDDQFKREKEEVELSLARTIYTQLEQGTLPYKDAQKIAQFVLSRAEKIKNREQLFLMLDEMAKQWPIFETIRGLFKLKMADQQKTQEGLSNAKQILSSMTG